MYREESVSSAFSSVNGKSRGALDRKVRVDGVTLREKLRTKDGKITKAKAQMRKSASALSPEALYFFRDEMEKEAILTPASALKAMNFVGKGRVGQFFQPAVNAAGRLGFKAQEAAVRATPAINSIGQSAMYGPEVALATAKGLMARPIVRTTLKPVLKSKGANLVAKGSTFEAINNPGRAFVPQADITSYIPAF